MDDGGLSFGWITLSILGFIRPHFQSSMLTLYTKIYYLANKNPHLSRVVLSSLQTFCNSAVNIIDMAGQEVRFIG